MISFLGGILVGLIISLLIGLILIGIDRNNKKSTKELQNKYIRRGIYTRSYTSSNPITLKEKSFDVQFELGELESTTTKSKVEVIHGIPSLSEYNTDGFKEKIVKMINNTWIPSDEIEWISDLAKVRGDKLDQILGK